RLWQECGFFCSCVLPSTRVLRVSSAVISSRSKARVARLGAATVTRLEKLNGDGSRLGCKGRKLEQPVGGGGVAGFRPETLRLHHREELLDRPAHLVPLDDLPSRRCTGNRMGSEQAPVHRLDARRRIKFDHLDKMQPQTRWQIGLPALRPLELNR